MDIQKNLIRPIIIGVAGASRTGKSILRSQIESLLKDYKICKIFLYYYRKNFTKEEQINQHIEKDSPPTYDFEALVKDIDQLSNGKNVTLNFNNQSIELQPQPVILIEGVLTLYDQRLRNLLDLKIFIDVDLDNCLMNKISTEMSEDPKSNLNAIIEQYYKEVRPIYVKYLAPCKKYADIILPQIEEGSVSISILTEYLKMQLNKVIAGDLHYIFTSQNEIVDPKYQYFNKKILVTKESSQINFFKQVFEDVITNEEDEFIIDKIQDKLISILIDNLFNFFREKSFFRGYFPKVDLIITEFDDLTKYNWTEYKKVIFFKTVVMNEEDSKIPEMISKQNKKCSVIVNSIFLAPKLAEFFLSTKLDTLLHNTLYFSDFLTKFEHAIKENKNYFNSQMLAEKFKKAAELLES